MSYSRSLGATLLAAVGVLTGGVAAQSPSLASAEMCVPAAQTAFMPESPRAYAAMCEPELGVAPTVDCSQGGRIRIKVAGEEVLEDPGLHGCDDASLQMGDCMPGSSLQRHEGRNADGTPRSEVVWVSFCRHDGRGEIFNVEIGNSVQMIGYNYDTGATCFFESNDNSPWTSADETNRLVGVLPGPEDADFDDAYVVPGVENIQCVRCHQADPFIHNPWIKTARLPENPRQPVLPVIPGENPPYYVVGAPNWDMRTIHIEGNGCLGCHRMGMETVGEFVGDFWDPNEHMPPRDPGSLAADYEALVACWENGPESTPGCDWVVPPAGECAGGVVGPDYPHASAGFNRGKESAPHSSGKKWMKNSEENEP